MYWLIDSTSGASSLGTAPVSSGVVSSSLRAATVADSRFSGRSPRPTPSHTMPSASTTSNPSCSSDPDLARERLARLDRLADHHPHDARLRGRHVVHRDAQRGHPQLLAAIDDVVTRDEQRAVACVAPLRQRQVR